ncbi:MAG TPA: hypothetical protein VKD72_01545 [Gemmataceae bacterium]|nr:hypothetical protein [Gemmataceae bacterium]
MTVQGIRVYVLARERCVPPKTVLEVARRLGFDVRNQLSTLEPQQRAAVEKSLDDLPPDELTGMPSRLRPRGPGPGAAHQELSPPHEE